MTPLPPVDACQSADCFPGDRDALTPLALEDTPAGVVGSFECPCGQAWQTLYDEFGWVVERTAAPVVPSEGRRAAA